MRHKRSGPPSPRPAAARTLEGIALEAVRACDPRAAVRRAVRAGDGAVIIAGRAVPLRRAGRLLLFAYGKAAAGMAAGVLERLVEAGGGRRIAGMIVTPAPPRDPPPVPAAGAPLPRDRFQVARSVAGHPLPTPASFAAGRSALRLAARAGKGDDVVFLASGGGSALLAAPLAPFITTGQKTALHRLLLASGAGIASINAVRKHLSAVKGGRLAIAARRAGSQTTLVLCDVDPERYEEVASGPSVADPTTIDDLVEVVARYGLAPALPVRVLEALRAGRLPETPKPRDPVLRRSRPVLLLSNRDLRGAAVRAGLSRGLPAEAMPAEVSVPVEGAVEMVARAIEAAPSGTRLLVLGGEVRTTPGAPGKGGRAQEFALRLALRMAGLGSRPWAFLAIGSDGIDGNSPAAGAFADGTTLERARRAGLDPGRALRDAGSFRFFNRLGDALMTGPTGTNVRDLYLLLTGGIAGAGPSR